VDTGASHILFQKKHMHLLSKVQFSNPLHKPFATLRAANGQLLKAIGRGILKLPYISVVAYIFNDKDLVHNLLGIAPFADRGCEAVFTATEFNLYHGNELVLAGKRYNAHLWHITLPRSDKITPAPQPNTITAKSTTSVLLLHDDTRRNAKYVQFVHACLGSPPPTTFLRAVSRGYLSGPNQFPRLTAKMVRKHIPDSEATAKGHLDKTPTGQPHASSQSVSAQRRLHQHRLHQKSKQIKTNISLPPFDPTTVPRSTTIHIDHTGRLPTTGSLGTLCYLIACWGSYTHIVPVTSLRGPETAAAIKTAVEFFRRHDVRLTKIRMDNQLSPEAKQIALDLDLEWELVLPYQHEPNRAKRAIRTAKNHLIAIRAGFHIGSRQYRGAEEKNLYIRREQND
jgi:hypothetical protein